MKIPKHIRDRLRTKTGWIMQSPVQPQINKKREEALERSYWEGRRHGAIRAYIVSALIVFLLGIGGWIFLVPDYEPAQECPVQEQVECPTPKLLRCPEKECPVETEYVYIDKIINTTTTVTSTAVSISPLIKECDYSEWIDKLIQCNDELQEVQSRVERDLY